MQLDQIADHQATGLAAAPIKAEASDQPIILPPQRAVQYADQRQPSLETGDKVSS